MDLRNRINTPCKHMFVVNPKILRPPGAEIIFASTHFAKRAHANISAPEGRRILGLTTNIDLHGVSTRFLMSI